MELELEFYMDKKTHDQGPSSVIQETARNIAVRQEKGPFRPSWGNIHGNDVSNSPEPQNFSEAELEEATEPLLDLYPVVETYEEIVIIAQPEPILTKPEVVLPKGLSLRP